MTRGRSGGAVVIGIGSPLGGDDAAGLEAARQLRTRSPAGSRVVELDADPGRLIEAWDGTELTIVVDAARSRDAPGHVRRIDLTEGTLPVDLRPFSTHGLGLGDAVELARALGRLPRRLVVYAITAERLDAGEPLSAAVEEAIPGLVERVLAELGA